MGNPFFNNQPSNSQNLPPFGGSPNMADQLTQLASDPSIPGQLNQFASAIQGNPEQMVRSLVSSGQMSPQQYQLLSMVAPLFQRFLR